ncbi:hypothetical protein ACFST9_11985 [Hymenobacter monticola]|uniref:Curlin associated repeat-containing protein n=1 Tax=Hymenobacter monticola TaxID=1705399 RepID=A0ABY4BB47_9BACT|nr:hypothetical protein [Hymenobacter monticola]UOE36383.1 hypothetical protein MTP16_05425 [Hymenobacter monticola]
MKKLTLLVGAALLVSAAHAQVRTSAPTTNPTAPTTRTAPTTAMTAAGTPQAIARPDRATASTIDNDSYVQQVGDGQQAVVSQTGTGRNTADIQQSPSGLSTLLPGVNGGNFASQTQVSTGSKASADQNIANIRQYGITSAAIQEQGGIRNTAVIQQGSRVPNGQFGIGTASQHDYASQKQTGNDNMGQIYQNNTNGISDNSATQDQKGNHNNAMATQDFSNHISVQKQGGAAGGTGDYNNASVAQKGQSNYASQDQQGSYNKAKITQNAPTTSVLASYFNGVGNNQATQLQVGNNNEGIIDQSTSYNYASQSQTLGNNNYAETLQRGTNGINSAYSTVTQQGSNNTAVVHQGAQ